METGRWLVSTAIPLKTLLVLTGQQHFAQLDNLSMTYSHVYNSVSWEWEGPCLGTVYILEGFKVSVLIQIQIFPGNPVPKEAPGFIWFPPILDFGFLLSHKVPKPLKCAYLIHSLAPSETSNNPRTNPTPMTKMLQLHSFVSPLLLSQETVEPAEQEVLQETIAWPSGGFVPTI